MLLENTKPVKATASAGSGNRNSVEGGRLAYIDGVRAIAIVAVVAFHAQIPGFRGGFVGVDVFFVISGFLITQQIVKQYLDHRFSFVDFYSRRILRILPPLYLVTLVTVVLARFFPVLRGESRDLAHSAAATAMMISNYYFTSGTEYFAVHAEINPLLHTWSLGVEEQYYLLAPAFVGAVVMWGLRRKTSPIRALLASAAIVIIISYLVLAVLTKVDHRLAFFSIMSRAWQFSIGGMLAVAVLKGTAIPKKFSSTIGIIGFLCVALSIGLYTDHISYPGYFAAWLPVIGTALLLVSGLENNDAPVTRILSSSPLVAIGLLSYSWYLWHWPLTELAKTLPIAEDSVWKNVAASAVALLLSVPTYLFMERPLRSLRQRGITRRFGGRIVAIGLAGSAALAIVALTLARYPAHSDQLQVIHLGHPSEPMSGCRSGHDFPNFTNVRPRVVGANGNPSVLFWGDSHTLMLIPVAEWSARAAKRTAVVLGDTSCPPLDGVDVDYFVRRTCARNNDEIRAWLKGRRSITGVVLAARWNLYSGKDTPAGDANLPQLLWSDPNRHGGGFATLLATGLTDLMTALTPQRRVLVMASVPELKHLTVNCLLRAQLTGQPAKSCAMKRADVERRGRETLQVLKGVVAKFANARIIDPLEAFCDRDTCWPFGPEGVFYVDHDHLSPLGAEVLYRKFKRDFDWVVAGDPMR